MKEKKPMIFACLVSLQFLIELCFRQLALPKFFQVSVDCIFVPHTRKLGKQHSIDFVIDLLFQLPFLVHLHNVHYKGLAQR